jgi:hypothetical protein
LAPLFIEVPGIEILGSSRPEIATWHTKIVHLGDAPETSACYRNGVVQLGGTNPLLSRPLRKAELMSPEARERAFDALATEMASGSISRGKALKLMGAALVGGTLASLGIGEAAADNECKPVNKKCRKNHQCCSGKCEGGTCACLPDHHPTLGIISPCTSGTQCCSGFCSGGFCVGRNSILCVCQTGGTFATCTSIACSDATALNQFCTDACVNSGGSAGPGAYQCNPEVCVR